LLAMHRIALVAFILLLPLGTALARPRPSLVPPGWKQVFADSQTRTRRFESADRLVLLETRQVHAHPSDLSADIDGFTNKPGERITYQRRGRTWAAVSGYKGNEIFYRKINLACAGARWNQVEFLYPIAEKERLDRTVTAIARGMTRYSGDCQ
jgi:hypothetical protein